SRVALFRWTGPEAAPPPGVGATAETDPRAGTTICSPSAIRAARLTRSICALGVGPPARVTASATRDPSRSRYRPGLRTAPTTSTYIVAGEIPLVSVGATRNGGATAAGFAGRSRNLPAST